MQKTIQHAFLFRVVYSHPQLRDILSGVYIRISNIAAACTAKVFAVSITNALTDIAGLAGIVRVYGDKGNTGKLGLVLKERTKLKESPGVVLPFLFFADSSPIPDSGQVLNGNSFVFGLCFCYNGFTDSVIGDSSEALFTSFKPFQELFTALSAFTLNAATHFKIFISYCIKSLGTVSLSVGSAGYIGYPKVYAYKFLNVLDILFRHFNGLEKIKLALLCHKISLAFDVRKILQVMADKRKLQPSINRPQGSRIPFIGKDAGIVSNRAERPERSLYFPVQLISIGNLADTANKHLRGKAGTFLQFVVGKMMKLKLVENLLLPRNLGNLVANVIRGFHRIEQRPGLFFGRQQFHLQSELHAFSMAQIIEKVNGSTLRQDHRVSATGGAYEKVLADSDNIFIGIRSVHASR
jgi:hypothetical protein